MANGKTASRGDEAIAAARQGLDEAGRLRRVAEDLAELADGDVDAVIGIDEGTIRPQRLPDLITAHHPAGPVEQKLQDAKGLLLEGEPLSAPPQLSARRIQLEGRKLDRPEGLFRAFHDGGGCSRPLTGCNSNTAAA